MSHRTTLLDHGEAGELVILALPVVFLAVLDIRSGGGWLAAALVVVLLLFGGLAARLWWSNRPPRPVKAPLPDALALPAPPPIVPPLAAGVFVDAVPVETGGA